MTPEPREVLDQITLSIDHCAQRFGVTFHAAALRAVSLGIITQQDLDDLRDLARQERVIYRLSYLCIWIVDYINIAN